MLIEHPRFRLTISDEAQRAFEPYQDWFIQPSIPASNYSPNLAPIHLLLEFDEQTGRFRLLWTLEGGRLKLDVQTDQLLDALARGPVAKKGPLNQALGKKTRIVFDATGGWANDSMLFASQGMSVVSAERNPILAMMTHQALHSIIPIALQNQQLAEAVPQVHFGPADQVHAKLATTTDFDCVYFDPMFPPKRKKSAKSNKQMQFAQSLLDGDPDASEVATAILQQGARRLVVKRPHHALPLLPNAEQTFSANLVEYDVYLNH